MRELEADHHYHIPGKYKAKIIAKSTAELWKVWIICRVADSQNYNLGNENDLAAFDKWKKTAQGKDAINNTVTDLLYHLCRTNNDIGWTEQERHNLVVQLYNETRTTIVHYLTELATEEERQGHQYIPQPRGEHGEIQLDEVDFDGQIDGEIGAQYMHEHAGEFGPGQHPVPFSQGGFNHAPPSWD